MNIKHLCNIYLWKSLGVKIAYFQYLIFGKPRLTVRFTFLGGRTVRPRIIVSSMFMTVSLIVFWGIPSQIGEIIVCWLAVVVTGFHSCRTWADKSDENQLMHGDVMSFTAISFWMDNKIAQLANTWFKDFVGLNIQYEFAAIPRTQADASPIRPDFPLVTDIVSGEAWDRQPSLLSLIGDRGKVLVSHGASLLHRVASGLEPPQGYSLVAAHFLYH